MNITTITLIVAGIALALAIEVAIYHFFGIRKISKALDAIKTKVDAQASPMQLLIDKYANNDYEEPAAPQPAAPATPAADKKPTTAPVDEVPSRKPSPTDAALLMANDVFLPQYKQLLDGLDEHNYKQRAPQMARLLIEMGVWLKDFLPISQDDFNVTKAQRDNVASIGFTEEQRREMLDAAPSPTGNAYATPIEVIALNHILKEWGVDDLALLIAGYKYQKQ